MRVFIENPAGSAMKHIYDERTLAFHRAVPYAKATPYHYGFILDTVSGDGDNLDCFILSTKPVTTGTIVEADPIGMVEYTDTGKEDHKILCTLKGESVEVNSAVQERITNFLLHVFDTMPDRTASVGRFLGAQEALVLIERSQTKADQ